MNTEELRILWEEIDDAIMLMPEAFLAEALDSPYLSAWDRARVKARLGNTGYPTRR